MKFLGSLVPQAHERGGPTQHGHLWLHSYPKGLSQGLNCGNPVGTLQTPDNLSLSFLFTYFNL